MNSNAFSLPAPAMAVRRGKPKDKDDDNRGELTYISIEVLDNGFVVSCSFEPKKVNPKLPRYDQMPEDAKQACRTPEEAGAYVTKMLRGESEYSEHARPGVGVATAPPALPPVRPGVPAGGGVAPTIR